MASCKVKNLIVFICLALLLTVGANTFIYAYAEGERIVANDIVINKNTINDDASQPVRVYGTFDFTIPETENTSTIEVLLYDNEGVLYEYTEQVQDTLAYKLVTLSSPIHSISYTDQAFFVEFEKDYIGQFSFKYQATVNSTTQGTYTTELKSVTINVANFGIIIAQKDIYFDQYSIITESDLYVCIGKVMFNGEEIDVSQLDFDLSNLDTNVVSTYAVPVTLQRGDDSITEYLYVTIEPNYGEYDVIFSYNDTNIVGSELSPYNFASNPNTTVLFNICPTNPEVPLIAQFTLDNAEAEYGFEETQTRGVYQAYIRAPQDFLGEINGTLSVYEEYRDELKATLVFKINYDITTPPQIIFVENYDFSMDKNGSQEQVDALLRNAVSYILEYDGSRVSNDSIQDNTKLVITHDVTDFSKAGTYNATYTYTGELSGLQATVTKQFTIENYVPEISQVQIFADSNVLQNNAELAVGQVLTITINAQDADGDEIEYFVNSPNASITQDEINKNIFTITPTRNFVGELSIQIYCMDADDSSEIITYTFTYIDIIAPTIEFTEQIINTEGTYSLQVNKNQVVNFLAFVKAVNDDIDNLNIDNVILMPKGFSLDETNRARFSIVDDYSITYVIADSSENTTEYVVNILVSNTAPVSQDVDGGIQTYNKEVIIQLQNYVQDVDNDSLTYFRYGYVYDQNDEPVNTNTYISYLEIDQISGQLIVRTKNNYIGVLKISYYAKDIDGLQSEIKTITINYVDNVSPTYEQTSLRTHYVKNKSQGYDKYGFFKATDEIDGDNIVTTVKVMKGDVEIEDIDFSVEGVYTLIYEFKDQSQYSLPSVARVTVTVDMGYPPQIVLTSDSTKIDKGSRFSIFDYIFKITDQEDGDKTQDFEKLYNQGSLKISNIPENTNTEGTYVIKMYYIDTDGNLSDTLTFTLIVQPSSKISPYYFIAGGAAVVVIVIGVVVGVVVKKSKMRI